MILGRQRNCWMRLAGPLDGIYASPHQLPWQASPVAVHREFFGSDGAFRAGPELPEFDKLYTEMATQLDRYFFEEALALFLCAPKALYAVNKHVSFGPYRTTFELAEAEVDDEHWSRTKKDGQAF
jgi:hypothetical protein